MSPVVPVVDTEPGLAVPGAQLTGAAVPGNASILITLDHSNVSELGTVLASISDPSSELFHQYLTAAEFDERFGSSPGVYSSAVEYFGSFHVGDLTTYADRTTLSFDATSGQVLNIFHTSLGEYRDALGRSYYAPEGPPQLPAPLAPFIAGVQGLSDYSKFLLQTDLEPEHLAMGSTPSSPAAGTAQATPYKSTPCSSAGGPFQCTTVGGRSYPEPAYGTLNFGSDLQVPYDVSGLYKSYGFPVDTTVATILWVDTIDNSTGAGSYCSGLSAKHYAAPYYPSDVSSYYSYTLPSNEPKPHAIGVPILDGSGQAPGPGQSASCDSGQADFESTLDLDMVGSMAPGANIYEVYGDAGNSGTTDLAFADILNPSSSEGTGMTASTIRGLANVSAISNSWGYEVFNDTSWYSDLEEAQVRGITVLAATPDAGGNFTSAPGAQAYDAFGDVAVGGTTILLNSTTLQRTSEVAWYEGTGTGSGSSGGVATVTDPGLDCGTGAAQCFPEPSWQRASADANGVLRKVGDGRAEPDIAAMANNTPISITWQGSDYPLTCLVNSCEFYILTGDSVATPLEAGIVDTIDHSLYVAGRSNVGFLDPEGYELGQGQYAGNFTGGTNVLPFFDVTTYGNANFVALRGYDLVTGWGPINAQNLTAFLLPHTITFTETGLPGGTRWNVTLNGVLNTSTSSTIGFSLLSGTYRYQIGLVPGYHTTDSGTVLVKATSVKVTVKFSTTTYSIEFKESGLPSGMAWNVTISGNKLSSTSSHITFSLGNGTYGATIGIVNGYNTTDTRTVVVSGLTQTITVKFDRLKYHVEFKETGLPKGTSWSVKLGTATMSSTGTSISFNEPNASYPYTVSSVGYTPDPSSGTAGVSGAAVTTPIIFETSSTPFSTMAASTGRT
jgi:subtilase family serine protease